jgi:hypothetical protein
VFNAGLPQVAEAAGSSSAARGGPREPRTVLRYAVEVRLGAFPLLCTTKQLAAQL